MKTAFETAIEISYYAGKLWDISTNPDIAVGRTPVDYTATHVAIYPENNPDKFVLSGQVPAMITRLFESVTVMKIDEADDLTRSGLARSIATLGRVLALKDPAAGYTTSFSNLQDPLRVEMARISAVAEELKLGRP